MIGISQKNRKKNYFINQKILLVEHVDDVRDCIVNYLRSNGHRVDVALNGMVALDKFKSNYYDLIIIDKNLPYNDAVSLAESIENSFTKVPILYISDRDNDKNKPLILIQNFEKDFSNYFVYTQKSTPQSKNNNKHIYQAGAYTLNTISRQLQYKNETPVKLSPKLNKLLRILIQHKGDLVTKELLIKKVWYNEEALNLKSIGVYITKLRKLLMKDPTVKINNVYKIGFILTDKN